MFAQHFKDVGFIVLAHECEEDPALAQIQDLALEGEMADPG